eukprot:gnl/MRDRNA2_/MRDRNA2_70938_c0_seq1.p1 gnl/MRDRNA2_/MRDRNA2_70938_c0~~gnl/MRDRNA2_/MRDRNA2_70938_c0_seq1.p1  ORF type:complete len:344 (+),score=69.84 gnl/MRDRNA2_/MRDRNA2_70938_c0_seq1:127-1158(+)
MVQSTRDFEAEVKKQLQLLEQAGEKASYTFPPGLNNGERKYIHTLALQMGLHSGSTGDGEARRITVSREKVSSTKEEMSREEKLSRMLTSVLRHRAHEEGLWMSPDGFVGLDEVLRLRSFEKLNLHVAEIKRLVSKSDEKRRFMLREMDGKYYIRANQGHTIREVTDSELLTFVDDAAEVPICVHGTYLISWSPILQSGGLSRMSRNHIHFAPQPPGDDKVISGMRSDCEVAVYINVASAMADGIQFFRSENKVILSRGDSRGIVPLKHFDKAVRLKDNVLLWPEVEGNVCPQSDDVQFHVPDTALCLRKSIQVSVSTPPPVDSDDEDVVLSGPLMACPNQSL